MKLNKKIHILTYTILFIVLITSLGLLFFANVSEINSSNNIINVAKEENVYKVSGSSNPFYYLKREDKLLGNNLYLYKVDNVDNVLIATSELPSSEKNNFEGKKLIPANINLKSFLENTNTNFNEYSYEIRTYLSNNFDTEFSEELYVLYEGSVLSATEELIIIYTLSFLVIIFFLTLPWLVIKFFKIKKSSILFLSLVLFWSFGVVVYLLIQYSTPVVLNSTFSNYFFEYSLINNYEVKEDELELNISKDLFPLGSADEIAVINDERGIVESNQGEVFINQNEENKGKSNIVISKLGDSVEIQRLNIILDFEVVNKNAIREEINNILGEQASKYGIYVYDLKRNIEIGINHEEVFVPASISKVPVGILALRDVEAGKYKLDDKFPLRWYHKKYSHDTIYNSPLGTEYTVEEYLTFSIVDSCNSSNAILEELIGGWELINEKTKNELGAQVFFRYPHDARAVDIGRVFRGIYTNEYLNKENNDLLIHLLKNTASWLQDGIPVGVPEGVEIAHKTGQLPEYAWEDAGIVYGEYTDYVLVVINEDIEYDSARQITQDISKLVYDSLN